MKLAIHLEPETRDIAGVWLYGPICFYPHGTAYPFQLGKEKMDSFVAYQAATLEEDKLSWDQWCEYLAGKTPVNIWWEVSDALLNETPEQAYQRLLRL